VKHFVTSDSFLTVTGRSTNEVPTTVTGYYKD